MFKKHRLCFQILKIAHSDKKLLGFKFVQPKQEFINFHNDEKHQVTYVCFYQAYFKAEDMTSHYSQTTGSHICRSCTTCVEYFLVSS